jgi:thiol-disulfide isomerase/thioredoxin
MLFACNAAAQCTVLIELFTNYTCGPCKRYEPMFDSTVTANKDRVNVIRYTTGFPGSGGFFRLNYVDQLRKQMQYGVGGVPLVFVNGKLGGPMDFTGAAVDEQYNRRPFASLEGNARINGDSIQLDIDVAFDSTSTDTLMLWAAVVADEHKRQLRQLFHLDTFVVTKDMKRSTQAFAASALLTNTEVFQREGTNVVAVLQRKSDLRVFASGEIVPVLQ